MGDLFDRDATLTVGSTRIAMRDPSTKAPVPTLRMTFKIVRTTSKTPDSAEIAVFNLSKENRSSLQAKHVACALEAGYVGAASQIFAGALSFSQSVLDGTDWVTKLQMGDGIDKIKSARVNIGIKGPVTAQQAIQAVAGAMGLGAGNVSEKAGDTSIRQSLTQFVNGIVLSGKAELQLDKLAKATGRQWFVQNGALHLLGDQESLPTNAAEAIISLKPGTGLIGSPQAGEEGVLKVRSLLMPDLLPGYKIRLESGQVKPGDFRIEKVTFLGDTWGPEWYADLEVKPLSGG